MSELRLSTPNGNPVVFECREGTNDHNTVFSIAVADEYALRGQHYSGWALDLGGHVGGVAICLAIDNPGLAVVCVEPIPENVEAIVRNAMLNDVAGQIDVRAAAVGAAGTKTVIRYGFRDAGELQHHAWVGHTTDVYAAAPVEEHCVLEVDCLDLAELRAVYGGPPAFVKVDCEGGEWVALAEIAALQSPRVTGEWHPVLGRERADELVEAFVQAGYSVHTSGPVGGPGLFEATLP